MLISQRIVIMLLSFYGLSSFAQATNEEKVKAAFVYNFTHFVQWPSEAFNEPEAPFIIGIVGNGIASSLAEIVAGETYNGHPIKIQKIEAPAEATTVHILFINGTEEKLVSSFIAAVNGKPILTVSDKTLFMKEGGMILLLNEGGKIKLEINARQADQSHLSVSAKLLNLARIYDRK